MWNSLRVRLLAMMTVVVAAAVGMAYLFADRGTEQAVSGLAAVTAGRDQRLAASLMAELGPAPDVRLLQAQAERLAQAMNAQILVTGSNGQVFVDSSRNLVGQALGPAAVPFEAQAEPIFIGNEPAYVVLRYPGVGEPGGAGRPAAGAFVAAADIVISGPVQAAQTSINRSLLLAALGGGGAALALALLFSQRVVSPLEALTAAALRLKAGDLSQRVTPRSKDEIGQLAQAFNAMADGLARTEQLRRQLVSDVAHELRTPLTNLRGYLEAVRDGVVEPKPEVVDSLYEETMHLIRLVDDLQDLALAEAGQLRLEPQPVALGEAVSRTLAALPPQLIAQAAPITVAVGAEVPPVYADPGRLRQVLTNLLANAIAHTPRDGRIEVAAQRVADEVEVRVRDTGAGIAPEHLPFVFERFYRADPARARATGGAGLGLAIVRQLVEAQGGRVSAESALGRGSTFTFTVPIAHPAPAGLPSWARGRDRTCPKTAPGSGSRRETPEAAGRQGRQPGEIHAAAHDGGRGDEGAHQLRDHPAGRDGQAWLRGHGDTGQRGIADGQAAALRHKLQGRERQPGGQAKAERAAEQDGQ